MPIAIGTTKDENSIVAKGTYVWRICLYCHCELAVGECGNLRAVGHHPTRLLRCARNDRRKLHSLHWCIIFVAVTLMNNLVQPDRG